MNKENFWDVFKNNSVAVNCETENEAEEFLKLCEENKLNWLFENDCCWSEFKTNTCYANDKEEEQLSFSTKHWYEQRHYDILSYKVLRNSLTINKEIIAFENGSIIQTIKSNDTIRGKGFINNLNDMYNKLEDKNFKVGDYVYCKNYDDFFNSKYFVGKIDNLNKNSIHITGFLADELPISKEKYIEKVKYEAMKVMSNCSINEAYKLNFSEDYKQQIVDKMEVLTTLIDLYLDIKNEKAFNACVKEYKELEYKLNKSEVLV